METVYSSFQGIASAVGLGSPFSRFAFFSLTALAIEIYAKPEYAFANGAIRPWAFYSSEPGATYIPIGLVPAIIGTSTALFL